MRNKSSRAKRVKAALTTPRAIICTLQASDEGYEVITARLIEGDKTVIFQDVSNLPDKDFWERQTDIPERIEVMRTHLLTVDPGMVCNESDII
jgi:hypothetical protein